MKFDILVGLQHGDEGKGKVVHYIFQQNKYNYCVRFNGGPNAGHTVYHQGTKLVLHQLPVGIVWGVKSLIGPGCVINLKKLNQEIKYLEENGIKDVRKNLYLAHNAHIILDRYIEEDKRTDTIGSTGEGIKPTYANKYLKTGVRLGQLLNLKSPKKEEIDLNLDEYDLTSFDILNNIIDSNDILNQPDNYILFEGAQGYSLDIDWGDYPYVTSSHCLSFNALSAGVPMQSVNRIYGISKIYDTYVGSKVFQEPNNIYLQKLAELGEEFGATTGRNRQCNWLDLTQLKKAAIANGITDLVINKCDIIQQLGKYCCYINRELIEFDDFDSLLNKVKTYLRDCQFLDKIYFSGNPNTI